MYTWVPSIHGRKRTISSNFQYPWLLQAPTHMRTHIHIFFKKSVEDKGRQISVTSRQVGLHRVPGQPGFLCEKTNRQTDRQKTKGKRVEVV